MTNYKNNAIIRYEEKVREKNFINYLTKPNLHDITIPMEGGLKETSFENIKKFFKTKQGKQTND